MKNTTGLLLSFVVFALVATFVATTVASLDISENVLVRDGRSVLHRRDLQDDLRAMIVKEVFHYDHANERLLVTIMKKGGGKPTDEAKEVLGKLFRFAVLAENEFRSECWLYVDTINLNAPLSEDEQKTIEDLIVRPIARPIVNAMSEGVASEKADQVIEEFGYTGEGVVVGIISDSFNLDGQLANKIAAGELPSRPGAITILSEGVGCTASFNGGAGCSNEGRRLAEVIYDTAVGANYLFYSAVGGALTQAQAILTLAANGAQIIVDDVIYLSEPWFETGDVYNAVTQVAGSSIYVISAGNFAGQSFQQYFKESSTVTYTKAGQRVTLPSHGFYKDKNGLEVQIPANRLVVITMQWAEPRPQNGGSGAQTDLDLLIDVDSADIPKVTQFLLGTEYSIGGDPYEVAAIQVSSPIKISIAISKASGTANPLFKVIVTPEDSGITKSLNTKKLKSYQPKGSNAQSTIVAQTMNPLSVTVAAVPYNKKKPEGYTSLGGSLFFTATPTALVNPQIVKKPDIGGPDGVSTSEGRFYGTSCSSASVGGVLALLKQGTPTLTTTQALQVLRETATDIKPKGFDFTTGYGSIDALAAADELKKSSR
eukprot:TRINITY_DN663_c0_g1_i1.p1 TRINITY_DN663_c0_g1~~TRINITY_DN663_c0_g1_i1.p1  ORF type:complete len:598 (-),score=130.81 TRINITY_DN663_c0_g1_i1:85-1878(-)